MTPTSVGGVGICDTSGLFPVQCRHRCHCREMELLHQIPRNHAQTESKRCQFHQLETHLRNRSRGIGRFQTNQQEHQEKELMKKSYASFFSKNEWLLVCLVLLAMGIFYFSHLTTSGLWYDEAIEYFHSKYMTGTIPVGIPPTTENMLERIRVTFQPPLYNVLMYLWLSVFDSESTFRLAGVLTTFVGSIGIYCAFRKITGIKWALMGLCVYLTACSVKYYALECGEYNLLLCMECWMLYFFVCCITDISARAQKRGLIGFYAFAVLSIYSQYGSAFLIAALFVALCCVYIKRKDYVSLRWLFGLGAAVTLVAIIPLWIWFIQIQLQNQGTTAVNHNPVFVGNVFYSLKESFCNNVSWIFTMPKTNKVRLARAMNLIVVCMGICTIFSVFRRKRVRVLAPYLTACVICFMAFFIAGACTFYAYNWWIGQLGCNNIINGNRYILFFAPLLIFTLVTGTCIFCQNIAFKSWLHKLMCFVPIIIAAIFYAQMWLSPCGIKKESYCNNDIREATKTWIEIGGYRSHTLVQEWAAGTFHYYFRHSPVYNQETQENIITTDIRIRSKDKEALLKYLTEINVFTYPELYYVGNDWAPGHLDYLEKLKMIFIQQGYDIEAVKECHYYVILRMTKAS